VTSFYYFSNYTILTMKTLLHTITLILASLFLYGQSTPDSLIDKATAGFKFRSVGPAFMSGRIADIAIHPDNPAVWYVAVGSGGVWKTSNAGATFEPIFDSQPSFSIGCVTLDPSNPAIIWVGTGENVGGRHVGFGDGLYRSSDDGKTWQHMGLKESEHISKVVVHPDDSDVVWVAAQGPLWSKGGERGLYMTTDGGTTWTQTLGDDEWTGVTDIAIDPRNPDVLYAATWDRHRTVAAYMGGGPGTGLHKSTDGGRTWTELSTGLPTSNMGKIGLTISPHQPDVLYAAIELDRRKGGVYRSSNAGASWTKMSDAVSGATGPHYYQELYACPHEFDRLYLVDVRMQISDNGGKTFRRMSEEHKHSDNHAIAFLEDRPNYLLVGTDGGLYESYDLAQNWRYFDNLPLTQFYDIAIDDSEPFYQIYGGTQDNSTQCGPSQTDNVHGIMNDDWRVVLNWDGQQPAIEPGNPDIAYGQRQQGTLSRIDMKTGEVIDIQPTPAAGESYERWNWDAPILISPHDPKTVFFASQRLWMSTDRGDSWTALSGDLTRDERRVDLPIMGAVQSYDNPWDIYAMSTYNTITMIAQSPEDAGLIYIGTDDGLVQITEDGGDNWRKMEVGRLPGCPKTAYVNEIKADLYDANVAYLAADNIKYGDFQPYIYKTTDKGKTWRSMRGDMPDRQPVWRMVQDHVNKDLIFAGTEFGLYVTIDGGKHWSPMSNGLPPIAVRDVQIHRRENDLVLGTFGRGIYILDDLSPLRAMADEAPALVDASDAHWYVPRSKISFGDKKGSMGATHYVADNPPFGAVITYYLPEALKTQRQLRQDSEQKAKKANRPISVPDWSALTAEEMEVGPYIWLTITKDGGEPVRRMTAPVTGGVHRVAWDLRPDSPAPLTRATDGGQTMMVAPGTYEVSMAIEHDGVITPVDGNRTIEVTPLQEPALRQMEVGEVAAFWRSYEVAGAQRSKLSEELSDQQRYAKALRTAASRSGVNMSEAVATLAGVQDALAQVSEQFSGNTAKNTMGEKSNPTISSRFFDVYRGISNSTYGPTKTHLQMMDIIKSDLANVGDVLAQQRRVLEGLAARVQQAGGPEVMWE
jgi:photosystem II stability/assembly factor-like uncharacterized protein